MIYGVFKDGYHSDAGRTFIVGSASEDVKRFVKSAEIAFFEGIKDIKDGARVGDISYNIEMSIKKQGYTLLEEFEGHGIGKNLHEEPGVPNIGSKGKGPRLYSGMAIAIEPMVCMGKNDIYMKDDYWTIATVDKNYTTYYENTIIITKNGCEILTL